MATPARLEEGHEMDTIHHEAGGSQQSPSAVTQNEPIPQSSDAHHGSAELPGASSEESLGHSNFRRESDIKKAAPRGWPSIAAIQMFYTNFSIHRRFGVLMQRILTDQETKLAYLENKLEELDEEDKTLNPSRLKSLAFDPDRLLAACTQTPAPSPTAREHSSTQRRDDEQQEQGEQYIKWKDKDLLLEAIVPRLKSYLELLQLDKEMQKLPPISRLEHKIFYNEIRKYHSLDEPAYQFLYSNDDFITTVTDRIHQYFEALVYGDSPIMTRIKALIGRKQRNHSQDHAPAIEIDKRFIVVPIKVLVAFASGVLLLSPVAILFLVDLSRVQSFAVVVVFLFAFVAALSSLNTNWDTILVGLSAYMAVLVTFLSNLEQGRN
ncbi:hypothetical protein F4677DRAFT_415789 [Hypoxylon crocopeplum]|nr:hypothetical protein F4677DRAFT_415789 [Hypoxylon crocopeplum]